MRKVKADYDGEKQNFEPMVRAVKRLFGKELAAIFVHGSLFDGTFGNYSDYDIVVIADNLPDDVLIRDKYAQTLKRGLKNEWNKNPFSFDFYTQKEFFDSTGNGHPFAVSILTKGAPVFDPRKIFDECKKSIPGEISREFVSRKSANLSFLADKYMEQARRTIRDGQPQFAAMLASDAIVLFVRSKLIGLGCNIYQGEIYQFFIRKFGPKLSKKVMAGFWELALPAAQISFRLKQPHVDIPLQDTASIFKRIDGQLAVKLTDFYEELKRRFDK
jgi:predicted nucleotidyltransferase